MIMSKSQQLNKKELIKILPMCAPTPNRSGLRMTQRCARPHFMAMLSNPEYMVTTEGREGGMERAVPHS